ncbi:hypothetical protein FC778_14855 [Clostridium botulinum]|nr:hypothetical protein [Clostridium botulinum]NFL34486.1 hypothetical protein [Clostridium botulinum]NFM04102.1 hypothetical protein [Clostridium botulinum]
MGKDIDSSTKSIRKFSYNLEELLKYYESMTGVMSCLTSVIVRADFDITEKTGDIEIILKDELKKV